MAVCGRCGVAGRFLLVLAIAAIGLGTAGCRKPKEPANPKEVKKKLEKVVKLVLWKVDATAEQKNSVDGILDGLSIDLFDIQGENRVLVRKAMDALDAETVDSVALEQVAADGARLFERYLRRMIRAFSDMAGVLAAEQRHRVVKLWREYEFGK
ncbi:MAG TPA: periplasmic heavy metal sensor [Myxococcota bacterium]|nr:periplasmic heavy metal sensor [Myxococcota bacterium]HPV04130.1 periplasmic heavy metal sensor [Myxococcota bacterium]